MLREENRVPGKVYQVCYKTKHNKDLFDGFRLAKTPFQRVK
jgi:hypothetical protein